MRITHHAQVIGMVLQHGDATLQNKAVDILLSSVSHDPTTLRAHMLQEGGRGLFSQLLQLMIDSSDAGVQEQILEVGFVCIGCWRMRATWWLTMLTVCC